MLKSNMPNVPGAGAVNDTLDFVKNLWGSMSVPGMNIPGMAVPTLSVDDLDKKIADLKAVESWLNVNTAMLRGTIQALEVQRGTISTLKSMGASLAAAMKQPGANEESVLAATPFASAFFSPSSAPAPEPAKAKAAPEAPKEAPAPEAAHASAALMPNPGAWWNMLQDQFKQAVTSAMSSEAMANASAMAQDAAAKLSAASTRPAQEFAKTIAKSQPARAKASADKPPAKAGADKPRARKPKTSKE